MARRTGQRWGEGSTWLLDGAGRVTGGARSSKRPALRWLESPYISDEERRLGIARERLAVGVAVDAGVGVAVVLGLIVGIPTLRLKGPYFALATLAAAAIMQQVAINLWQVTGGTEGIYGLDTLVESSLGFYYFVLAVLGATVLVLGFAARSRWGPILRAIKGDETACQAAGINVTFYKIASLALSAAFAGLGGVLFAHYQQAVTPGDFDVFLSISVIIMAYVGGIGTIWGAACGGILLNLMLELMRGLGEYRLWVYYLILVVVLFFMREGFVAPLWRRL